MKIVCCMKQVPASSAVEIDAETGSLIRSSADTKTNPYDLYALETALRIKEKLGGSVTVLTMGPKSAESLVRDAYAMGADGGVILSDKKFAGSDVLATSFTLSEGIRSLGGADLIICGRQTTDGDTSQVGPAIAEHLHLPHAAWVTELCDVTREGVTVRQVFGSLSQVSFLPYPALITVEKGINVPRLPSYRLKRESAGRAVTVLSFDDLPSKDLTRYGHIGSPTSVEAVFPPEGKGERTTIEGTTEKKARAVLDILERGRFLQ